MDWDYRQLTARPNHSTKYMWQPSRYYNRQSWHLRNIPCVALHRVSDSFPIGPTDVDFCYGHNMTPSLPTGIGSSQRGRIKGGRSHTKIQAWGLERDGNRLDKPALFSRMGKKRRVFAATTTRNAALVLLWWSWHHQQQRARVRFAGEIVEPSKMCSALGETTPSHRK
jgi:hypothetical protein